jgi:hypothetical protein
MFRSRVLSVSPPPLLTDRLFVLPPPPVSSYARSACPRHPLLLATPPPQLRTEINKPCDPHSPDFTLEVVDAMGLSTHADFIGDLSATANKELAIETALTTIEGVWADMSIDLAEYKDVYFKIRVRGVHALCGWVMSRALSLALRLHLLVCACQLCRLCMSPPPCVYPLALWVPRT